MVYGSAQVQGRLGPQHSVSAITPANMPAIFFDKVAMAWHSQNSGMPGRVDLHFSKESMALKHSTREACVYTTVYILYDSAMQLHDAMWTQVFTFYRWKGMKGYSIASSRLDKICLCIPVHLYMIEHSSQLAPCACCDDCARSNVCIQLQYYKPGCTSRCKYRKAGLHSTVYLGIPVSCCKSIAGMNFQKAAPLPDRIPIIESCSAMVSLRST